MANGHVERMIGSIRRECLDHIIVFNERHLRRVLISYLAHYNKTPTHLALSKDAPVPRATSPRPLMETSSQSPNWEVCIIAMSGERHNTVA